ncbi:MAG: tetratricopeptide repeat protein, partial [candidate division Zixibacteria bacterium]|nr:tetratricopeptide repeat protein [candidate division Zixibacteria bacterium]
GYVENYSLFVLSVAMFSMCGLLVAQGKVSRGVVLPLLVLSCFLHVFGVCLIPSAMYLITSGTRFGARIANLNWKLKVLLTMLAVSAVAALFFRFYFSDYFFRFAVIPLVSDRFTVQGYWLLSLNHAIDFCNLFVLLVPSLLVVGAAGWSVSFRKLIGRRDYRYLAVLTMSATAAAFIFDPKLGMPRDWDLFSFAGIPLALTSIYLILDNRHRAYGGARIALLSAVLGSLVLVPRVVGQTIPEIAIARFNGYVALDMTKNMYGRITLLKYYEKAGDIAAVAHERERYVNEYPERMVNHEGVRWKDRGNCARAAPFFERALQMNPVFSAAFTNLGMCCQQSGQLDSAVHLFRIAVGLNPYNAAMATKLAGAYVQAGELEKAAKSLTWAMKIDPDNIDPLLGLIMVYERLGRADDRLNILSKLVQLPDAPVGALKEMGEHHLDRQEYERAAELFQRALKRGLDSTYVRQLINTHPQLGVAMR